MDAGGCHQRVAASYMELDIFPQHWNNASVLTSKSARHQRGLASLPFAFTMPSEAVDFTADGKPTIPGTSAATFLETVRNRTLLDLSCMREFSLLRAKPLPQRNLSQLSISSAYDMHNEQLHLQQLATQKYTTLTQNVKENNDRPSSPVKHQLTGLRSRITHTHRRILFAHKSKDDHVKQTPRMFTASPPQKVVTRSQQQPKAQLQRRRKVACKTLSVAEQHGFLLEQDLAALMTVTGYSRAELFARWARFKALCSMAKNSCGIDKETLRHGVPQLSVEDQFFVDRAFDVLDADSSGALDWPEFIAALSALEKGDAACRVDFLFHAYDLNGDGFIQRHEVEMFFLASLLVPQTPQALEVARHFVDKIFISLDREQEDSIRVQDAMEYLKEHPATDAYSLLGRTMVVTLPTTITNSRIKLSS